MKSKKHKKIQVKQLGFSKSNRDVHLDLLKALAITMVVFFHNAQLNPNGIIDNALMMFCNSGSYFLYGDRGTTIDKRGYS